MPVRNQVAYFVPGSLILFLLSIPISAQESRISLAGTVQDRDDRPVAGASVFVIDAADQWKTTTDERGAFNLKDVPPDGSFMFIECEGFRFHGEQLPRSNPSPVHQLTRLSESPNERLSGKDWTISRDERMQLIRRVFEPYLEKILASDKDADKLRPLELLAKIDPVRALEVLEQKPFKQPQMGMSVKGRIVEQLARDDMESAIEVAESFDWEYMRAFCFFRIAQLAQTRSKADRIALLARAAADAKSVKHPAQRIALLGLIAEALLDAGDLATAEDLLRKTQQAAEKVANAAWAGFARGSFAEKLVQIDVAAALPLVTDLKDEGERIRHLGNMAHELAAIKPADAERVLNMIKRPRTSRLVIHERDNYAVRVCYRMAAKDLPRAKSIAESCHEKNLQAYAYGLIAHAIAKQDRTQATELLRHAYDLLKDGLRDPQTVKIHSAQIAGCLLPTAEIIDPGIVREMIWRTIALRTPRDDGQGFRSWSEQQTSQLAAWLSRYDRATARAVLDRWHSGVQMSGGRDQYAVALTLVDPQRAVEFAESQEKDGVVDRCRLAVARTLVTEGDSRIRIPHREAGLWPIDAEDVDW